MALILIKGALGGDGGYYSICLSFKKEKKEKSGLSKVYESTFLF